MSNTTFTTSSETFTNNLDRDYQKALIAVHNHFLSNCDKALFHVSVRPSDAVPMLDGVTSHHKADIISNKGLKFTYLNGIDTERQQHYVCNTCFEFMHKYGNIVWVAKNGDRVSAVWPRHTDTSWDPIFNAMADQVEKGTIEGPAALSSKEATKVVEAGSQFGEIEMGGFRHFAITYTGTLNDLVSTPSIYRDHDEKMKMLKIALAKNLDKNAPDAAIRILGQRNEDNGHVKKLNNFVTLAKRIRERVGDRPIDMNKRIPAVDAIFWDESLRMTRDACDISGAPIGLLLEAYNENLELIEDDMTDDNIAMAFLSAFKQFAAATKSPNYMRPKAEANGMVKQLALKLIDSLKLRPAIETRRYATLADINQRYITWSAKPTEEIPATEESRIDSYFDSVKPRTSTITNKPIIKKTYTWTVFKDEILNNAEKIEVLMSPRASYNPFFLYWSDAVDGYLWKYESETERHNISHATTVNRVNSSYMSYNGPNGLRQITHDYYPAPMIVKVPSLEYADMIVLPIRTEFESSACLFPQILRSELYKVRAAMEHLSNSITIKPFDDMVTCFALTSEMDSIGLNLRVTMSDRVIEANIDRYK